MHEIDEWYDDWMKRICDGIHDVIDGWLNEMELTEWLNDMIWWIGVKNELISTDEWAND